MDMPSKEFALAGTLEELKIKGQLVVHGGHRPILVIYDQVSLPRWSKKAHRINDDCVLPARLA